MLIEWIRKSAAVILDLIKQPPFLIGICLGAGIILLICLIILIIRYRHSRCSSIIVDAKTGSVVYSINAIKSFIEYELSAFPILRLKNLKIRRQGSKVSLTLYVSASSGGNFSAIHDDLRQRILDSAVKQFGLRDTIAAINITLTKLEYDSSLPPAENLLPQVPPQGLQPLEEQPDTTVPLQPLQDK